MKLDVQRGFTLPEALAVLIVTGLMISLVGSFTSMRIDTEKIRSQRAESRYIASLVDHAYRHGLLVDDASTAADLQAALPHLAIPAQLSSGQAYRIALDDADPRVLVDIEAGFRDDGAVVRSEVVRAPAPVSELRLPFWRARQLRQIREEDE